MVDLIDMAITGLRPSPAPAATPTWAPLRHAGALDGLRAVAVVIVMIYHGSWLGLAGGSVGVDVFFALSGFLITRLLVDEWVGEGRISLRRFWVRRALRLLPPLLAMVGVVWTVALFADAPRLEDRLAPRTFWALSYAANWRDVVTHTHGGPFSHLWSLSVEEQFYVVWPVVVLAALRGWGHRGVARVAGVAAAVLAASTAVRAALGTHPFFLYFGTDSHGAILLLAGSWLGASPELVDRVTPDLARRLAVLGAAGLGVIALRVDRFDAWHAGSGYVPISVVSLALVTAAVVLPAWGPLAWGPVQAVGRASYALYLWHIPMFWIGPVLAPSIDSRIRVIGGAAIAAALSRYLVERPAARLRRRWG